MRQLEHKHPRPIRWMHWLNVVLLSGMIWSGLLIYWANDVYSVRVGSRVLFHFFPEWFYIALGLNARLAEGMAWHFFFMWGFALNGLAYVGYTLLSGEWRHLVPNRNSFREAWLVVLHDLHLSQIEPPKRKFNGAQQFAYTGVILMGGGSLLTGLAIYKPAQFAWLTSLLGGYEWARFEHFALTVGYVLFFLMHITQVIRAGWSNFAAMVCGYELTDLARGTNEEKVPLKRDVLCDLRASVFPISETQRHRGHGVETQIEERNHHVCNDHKHGA